VKRRLRRVTGRPDGGLWPQRGEYLSGDECEGVGRLLLRGESTGRPVGGVPFLEAVSRLVGRDLTPGKPGPKPKRKQKQG